MREFSWDIRNAPDLDLDMVTQCKNNAHLTFLYGVYVIHFKNFFITEVYTHTETEQEEQMKLKSKAIYNG